MVTINTTEDLLHALAENPRWKEAVRHEILTEELMNLPARFDRFAATTDAFMEEQRQVNANTDDFIAEQRQVNASTADFIAEQRQINAEQRQVNADTADFIAEQRQVNASTADFIAEQRQVNTSTADFIAEQRQVNAEQRQVNASTAGFIAEQRQVNAEQKEFNARVDRREERLQNDIGTLRADFARRNATNEAPDIAENMGFRLLHTLTRSDLQAMYEANDTAGISRGALQSFRRADLVIAAADGDGATHYIAVEISYTADERDTGRALRNAGFLTRFTGRPAHAAVASTRRDNRIQHLIDNGQIHWHQLYNRDHPVE